MKNKKVCIVFLLAAASLLAFSRVIWAMGYRPPKVYRPLRVAILKDVKSFKLTLRSPYEIFALKTLEKLSSGKRLNSALVVPAEAGIKIGNRNFSFPGIRIISKKGYIFINRRNFRGQVDIIRTAEKKLLVVNYVDTEDYLRGVLYQEVSHWWPMEVLKAQAIVARTFALYRKQQNQERNYDLSSDVFSQVYGGRRSETWRTNIAVNRTEGRVLKYQGKIFPTFYHANCGGHTQDASRIWNIDLEPLKGVKCDFCKRSKYYRWQAEIPLARITQKMRWGGYKKVGSIYRLTILERDPSGRVAELLIDSDKGKTKISGYRFRLRLGVNLIRSTNFTVKIKNDTAYFKGFGWGHGVGLCQWGAYFMARQGYRAQEILSYYYPGAEIAEY
jgi:stage II sporulation protein D